VYLRDPAKQIMQITHDVLVSAYHKKAEVIDFPGMNTMQRQCLFHVLQIDKLADSSV
jgi:hypothetical protein